jgi:hypothetical protein
MWTPFNEGRTAGDTGSEGFILRDDAHTEGARITLEHDDARGRWAITCGIYGWMMHTRFFGDEDAAERAFNDMKQALDGILRSIPLQSDPDRDAKMKAASRMIEEFVEQYP